MIRSLPGDQESLHLVRRGPYSWKYSRRVPRQQQLVMMRLMMMMTLMMTLMTPKTKKKRQTMIPQPEPSMRS